jgi:hypothetical protein
MNMPVADAAAGSAAAGGFAEVAARLADVAATLATAGVAAVDDRGPPTHDLPRFAGAAPLSGPWPSFDPGPEVFPCASFPVPAC